MSVWNWVFVVGWIGLMWFLLRSFRTLRKLDRFERHILGAIALVEDDCNCGDPDLDRGEPWHHTTRGCYPTREHVGASWRR